MKKGMTLIEVMVSLLILMIVMGAVYSVLNIQQTKALNVQSTSILQTDAQVAATVFRWDILMAAYGMSVDDISIICGNNSTTSDSVTLRGMGLSFEADSVDWSPVVAQAIGSPEVKVFRFNDSMPNFLVGDVVAIIDQERRLLDSNLVIMDIDTITHYPSPTDSLPAVVLTLDNIVTVGMGCSVFKMDRECYDGVTYRLVNGDLIRGNAVFLSNVEDMQLAYAVDLDNDGQFATSEWYYDLAAVPGYNSRMMYEHKTAVRATIMVRSNRGLSDYMFPEDTIRIEDHVYNLTPVDKKRKREAISSITYIRNFQP
jgi:prepilin-type N-terminal cleavage/methylation domain-containing protein